ncbi:hypothetical protein [Plantactinospora sp. WMMB782]|uniref:hypothetical protein n=1 Tax=Plantactinospora sp. WMMB782 TaxID=3404121 RepID=UPI003B9260F5
MGNIVITVELNLAEGDQFDPAKWVANRLRDVAAEVSYGHTAGDRAGVEWEVTSGGEPVVNIEEYIERPGLTLATI